MKIAEKIMLYRKKQGWSQEELAEKMNVSRQSVSKWESGVSVPDLDKIVLLSQLFAVTTDELLKDEKAEVVSKVKQENNLFVSLNQSMEFLSLSKNQANKNALAVVLYILSPLPLILLCYFSEEMFNGAYERIAVALGLTFLFLFVAIGVAIMILGNHSLSKYEFLEEENFILDEKAKNIIQSEYDSYGNSFKKKIAIGVVLCILAVIPLVVSAIFENELMVILSLALLFIIVSVGVYILVKTGIREESYQKLLQIEDYDINKKRARDIFSRIYWPIILAIYLGYSFLTNRWDISWIIWPVAGVLSGVVDGIQKAVRKD